MITASSRGRESITFTVDAVSLIFMPLALLVAGFGVAGGAYVMRNVVWTEGVFVISDFWLGIKQNFKQIIGAKGAAFNMACMSAAQNCTDVDMLMYYDARPSEFNGMFDFYTMEPLKGYYPFLMYSKLYELGNCVESMSDDKDIYVVVTVNIL